jgi:hypothetical protein
MARDHDRRREQEPTRRVSWSEIMTNSDAFACGVADVRAGRGFRPRYERPPQGKRGGANWQWNYERGRQWAVIAGPGIALAGSDGRLNPEALQIASDAGDDIL